MSLHGAFGNIRRIIGFIALEASLAVHLIEDNTQDLTATLFKLLFNIKSKALSNIVSSNNKNSTITY